MKMCPECLSNKSQTWGTTLQRPESLMLFPDGFIHETLISVYENKSIQLLRGCFCLFIVCVFVGVHFCVCAWGCVDVCMYVLVCVCMSAHTLTNEHPWNKLVYRVLNNNGWRRLLGDQVFWNAWTDKERCLDCLKGEFQSYLNLYTFQNVRRCNQTTDVTSQCSCTVAWCTEFVFTNEEHIRGWVTFSTARPRKSGQAWLLLKHLDGPGLQLMVERPCFAL